MPMKVNCGLSKKIGQPDYGSLGASCHVEFEADGSLLQTDLEAFHRHVRNAFVACKQAVHDELARHQQASSSDNSSSNGNGGSGPIDRTSNNHPPSGNGNGHRNGHRNGNGANGHRASPKQIDYVNQLARQIRGLGVRRLETLANTMFDKPVADLTSLDASGLIDMLKAIKAGDVNLDHALNGVAT